MIKKIQKLLSIYCKSQKIFKAFDKQIKGMEEIFHIQQFINDAVKMMSFFAGPANEVILYRKLH